MEAVQLDSKQPIVLEVGQLRSLINEAVEKATAALPKQPDKMTKEEAAEYLGITTDYLMRISRTNQVKGYTKLGNWHYFKSDLNNYLISSGKYSRRG